MEGQDLRAKGKGNSAKTAFPSLLSLCFMTEAAFRAADKIDQLSYQRVVYSLETNKAFFQRKP